MGHGSSSVKIDPKDLKDLRQRTEFSDREIKSWYQNFIKGCPDGKLDKAGMESMFAEIFPKGDAGTFTEDVFRTYDTNGDGSVDFKEFMVGISVTSKGSFEDKIQWAFEIYDQDGNGSISRDEAIEIIKGVQKMHGTSEESSPEETVDKMFESFDKNRDGLLSKEEFIEGSNKDPSFAKILEW